MLRGAIKMDKYRIYIESNEKGYVAFVGEALEYKDLKGVYSISEGIQKVIENQNIVDTFLSNRTEIEKMLIENGLPPELLTSNNI